MMDAREREESQARRTGIKRPWDEDTILSEPPRSWLGPTLPPIDAPPYRSPSLARGGEHEGSLQGRYGSDQRGEIAAKRARYEGHEHDYNLLSQENLDLNGKLLQAQATRKSRNSQDVTEYLLPTLTLPKTVGSIYNLHRGPLEMSRFPQIHPDEGWGGQREDPGGATGSTDTSTNTSNLCRKCRKLTSERQEPEGSESCEECRKDPELAHVTQKAALGLSQLATTLSSGISSDQRAAIGIIGVS